MSSTNWRWRPKRVHLEATAAHLLRLRSRGLIPQVRRDGKPYLPHAKQLEFLSYNGLEAFYGGAAAGGKSDALLMAAVMYCDEPGYAALLLRRTFKELNQEEAIMNRSMDWWTGKAKWNASDHRWTFPSGSTITFGYLENEKDKYQYLSAEYQFIGFDELTQFSESQYTYLFTRLRRKLGVRVPLRMRSASNPGGPFHAWVKSRYLESLVDAVYVPAKIKDNPGVDAYEYVKSLGKTDPVTRRQMLEGDWTDPEGGRFKAEWLRYYTLKNDHAYFGQELIPLSALRNRFLTVDPAATADQLAKGGKKDDPDWTVISAWASHPKGYLVWLGCRRIRVDIPDIAEHVGQMYLIHHAQKAYIEGFGIGKGPAQLCRRHQVGGKFMNVIEFTPEGRDKLLNSIPAQNLAEAGRLWLPANAPDFPLADVKAEVIAFTGDPKQDAHDDIVDTLSKASRVFDTADMARGGIVPRVHG